MKLNLDENLSRRLKSSLVQDGFDVATAADENLLSKPDSAVAAVSFGEGRMLLTLDVEFADLRKYPPGSHCGIILFRPPSFGPLAVNRFIMDFIRSADLRQFSSCVLIVEAGRVRVRRPG